MAPPAFSGEAGSRSDRQTDTLESLSSRARMREMAVRAYLHRRNLGNASTGVAAGAIAAEVDNPWLLDWVSGSAPLLVHLLGKAGVLGGPYPEGLPRARRSA